MAISQDDWMEFLDEVEDLREDCDIPGAAVAVIENRRQARIQGFGVRSANARAPVGEKTMFHIASTQKPMTSMFIATLVDQGVLGWDTPIAEVVPQFRLSDDSATRTVTMRHLLSMTSGIPASGEDDVDSSVSSPEKLFEQMAYLQLASRPGDRFDYSNISYALAGYAGALAAGGTWGQLETEYPRMMSERVFAPAGMQTATFSLGQAQATADCCAPHENHNGHVEVIDEADEGCDPLAPSGGARVNIAEMARFLMLELNGGQTSSGQQAISRANLEARWQSQIVDRESGTAYGLGWGVTEERGKTVLVHEGSFGGFMSTLSIIPETGAGLAVLANLDDEDDFVKDISDMWTDMMLPKKGIFGWFS